MSIKCPHCGTEYEVEKKDMYRYTKCEVCGKGFVAGATTSLQKDESKDAAAAALPKGKELSQKLCSPRSPLIAIKRQAAVDAEPSTAEANPESASAHQSFMHRPSFAPRIDVAARQSQMASLPVPFCGLTSSTGLWCAIIALYTAVGLLALYCMVQTSSQKSRYHAMMEHFRELTEEVDGKMAQNNDNMTASAIESIKPMLERVENEQQVRIKTLQTDVRRTLGEFKTTLEAVGERCERSERVAMSATTTQKNLIDEKFKEIMCQVEELSKQTAGLQARHKNLVAKQVDLAKRQKVEQQVYEDVLDGGSQPRTPPTELKRKFNENLAEIKRLRAENPACVLDKDLRSIRNTKMRMATKADLRYCAKEQITYVRDLFHCSSCNGDTPFGRDTPCCNVSRMKGYAAWYQARKAVEETTRINERIDELYNENAVLKKEMQR